MDLKDAKYVVLMGPVGNIFWSTNTGDYTYLPGTDQEGEYKVLDWGNETEEMISKWQKHQVNLFDKIFHNELH